MWNIFRRPRRNVSGTLLGNVIQKIQKTAGVYFTVNVLNRRSLALSPQFAYRIKLIVISAKELDMVVCHS